MGTPVPMAVENVPAIMTDNVWDLSFTGFKPICKLPSYQTSSARSSSFVYCNHLESLCETMIFWPRLTSPEIKRKWAVRLRNVAPLSVVAWYTLIISPSWLTWCKNIIDDFHNSKWKLSDDPRPLLSPAGEQQKWYTTLYLSPFKLQIVFHTLFRTRKDHIVLFDVLGHTICTNRSSSPPLTQTSACLTDT